MITPIESLRGIDPAAREQAQPAVSANGSLFGAIFRNAINNVVETEAEKTQAEYLLSTGQLDNPATMMISISKAQNAVQLLVQLRNRALDAYSELTRMSL